MSSFVPQIIIDNIHSAGHIKHITDINNYKTDVYGKHLYILTTDNNNNKQQPWLCINQIDFDNTDDDKLINDIRNSLYKTHGNTGNKIRIDALHRKYKGPLPTPLLLFKTDTSTGQDHPLNNDIQHDQCILKTRLYINKTRLQRTNCHKMGHTNKHCRNKQTCVRCGGDCSQNKCTNNTKRCINSNGNHSSNYKNCTAIKQHITRRFHYNTTTTYAQALTSQQYRLNQIQLEQQDKITKLSELHASLQTAHKTILELKATQTQIQEQIAGLRDELQQTKALNISITSQQNEINKIKQQISTTN